MDVPIHDTPRGRLTGIHSSQGYLTVNNRVIPVDIGKQFATIGRVDEEHLLLLAHAQPGFEQLLREVSLEVLGMREAGTLPPFWAPLGHITPRPPRRYSAAEVRAYHNKRMEWARAEMLALRARNDANMRRLLR